MAATRDPWAFQRWAYQQRTGNPVRKSLLMVLAIMAEKSTGECQAAQELLATWVEVEDSGRTVRRQLVELERLGLIARRHKYRSNGRRGNDVFLLLAPWITEWSDGTPLPDTESGSERGDYRTQTTPTTGLGSPDIERNQPLKNDHIPRTTPNGAVRGARARTNDDDNSSRVAVSPIAQQLLTAASDVAAAKDAPLPSPERIAHLADRFADRDLAADAADFADYWLHGRGENGRVRDVVATLRNWLARAPSAAARNRNRPSARRRAALRADSRARAAAAHQRIEQERAA